eukprot:6202514-Pleurochrysis_carterae.AAC.3
MQQDAEECWSTLVTLLAQNLKLARREIAPGDAPSCACLTLVKPRSMVLVAGESRKASTQRGVSEAAEQIVSPFIGSLLARHS